MDVVVVQHVRKARPDDEDVKMIGVYSTEARAQDAVSRLSTQPGFSDSRDGFRIDRYTLDQDHWTEGFVTTVFGD